MRRKDLPPELAGRSFALSSADDAGVARSRTKASDLITVSRGIRIPRDADAAGPAALRAYTEIDESSVLTHIAAAHVWGMPLPAVHAGDWRVHIARPRGRAKPRRANVVGHQLTLLPGEVVEVDGVRTTSPARTWLDLARLAGFGRLEELVAAGDSVVCAHGPDFPQPREALCSIDDLRRMVAAHAGMRGVRMAREAVERVRVGADSAPETFLRLALVDAGLPEPELNVILRSPLGKPVVWPDAAYPQWRISLQYDGEHHGGSDQHRSDMRRADSTEAAGWLEVRVGWEDLTGGRTAVVRKVRTALLSRGWSPGPTRTSTWG
ncbi:hypothetical protein [Arthrobacter sp. 35W]|uniref:hypothetical protein n=1 Tax=Arthrobacter sp. 35W TaxID=1132441 RepID=UPI0003FB79F3|nr:hypothetical protein [Arthrobacter sp. 35W]